MLNLGQVVYDLTNKRILIFGGVSMLQDQKSGKCHTEVNFLTEDLEEERFGKDEPVPFEFRNFDPLEGNKIPVGDFVRVVDLKGHFFGNVDFETALQVTEYEEAAKMTFRVAKNWPVPKRKPSVIKGAANEQKA